MVLKKIGERLIKVNNRYYTLSKKPGYRVYDEKTVMFKGKEYRYWDPNKSKIAAALQKGLPSTFIGFLHSYQKMLYLGIANGTTASHLEDINPSAYIFGVEISPRSMIDLVYMIKMRNSNIIPILENASYPEKFSFLMTKVDFLYGDIAQPNQTDIVLNNADLYLQSNGVGMIAIKTRSINIKKKPKEIVNDEIKKIENRGYRIVYKTMLDPYERDHGFVVFRKQ